jgi:hypothetical protein
MMLDQAWAVAFLLTEAVETPIYAVALRGFNLGPRLMLAFGASLLTHPFVWLFVSAFGDPEYWKAVTISEIFAVLVEAGYLRALAASSVLGWSIFANASSFGLGLLFRMICGIP